LTEPHGYSTDIGEHVVDIFKNNYSFFAFLPHPFAACLTTLAAGVLVAITVIFQGGTFSLLFLPL